MGPSTRTTVSSSATPSSTYEAMSVVGDLDARMRAGVVNSIPPRRAGAASLIPTAYLGRRATGSTHRRRRLPRAERRDPGDRPQGRRRLRARVRRLSRRLARAAGGASRARSRSPTCGGSCRAAARSSARRAPTPSRRTTGIERVRANLERDGVDGLIAIGGEDTLGVATRLHEDGRAAWSACRRRSTTTSAPPTTPSASTPRSTSRWARSTASTRRPRATSAP